MLAKLKIRTKLLVYFLSVAMIPFIAIGTFSFFKIQHILSETTFERLVGIREAKKSELERFFSERQADMKILSQNISLLYQHTVNELRAIQANKQNQIEWYFQQQFKDVDVFSKRQCVLQTLNIFDESQTGDASTAKLIVTKQKLDYQLTHYANTKGYYDILLINPRGKIIYSIKKNVDLNQNVREFQDTALYAAFKAGKEKVSLQDFTAYPPADQQQVAFFSAPIIDDENQLLGVLTFSILPDQLNNIVQMRPGMGKTGETYLVGQINERTSYRSNRLINESGVAVVGYPKVGPDIEQALLGNSRVKVKMGSTGRLELGAYAPLSIPHLNWAIVSNINLEEIIAPQLKNNESYFRYYIERYNYYDLSLIHPKGDIFYTVAHEDDFGTNILHGKYRHTKLNEVVQTVLKNKTFAISDYEPYAPSNYAPSAFMAHPLLENDEIVFIVALQFTENTLNKIMQKREGMSNTGEAYLVGSDYLMRSNSFLALDTHSIQASFANPNTGSVKTKSVQAALTGKTGQHITKDYLGNTVFSTYTSLKIGDFQWALITEINEEEALASVRLFEQLLGTIALLMIVITLILIMSFSRNLLLPLVGIYQQLVALSQGRVVEQSIAYQAQDEIGGMIMAAKLVNKSMQQTIEQANSIAEGHYEKEVILLSEDDQLGKSLAHMTQKLQKMTAESEAQNWLKTGQTQLNDHMRGEQDIHVLVNKIIQCLTSYLKAQAGTFYIVQGKEENKVFHLIATQGYTQRKKLAHEYKLGEGLVGQAALEKELIVINHLSDIETNIIHHFEMHAAAIPFVYEGNVIGVIELYTLHMLSDIEIEFLFQVMPSIGITIHSIETMITKY